MKVTLPQQQPTTQLTRQSRATVRSDPTSGPVAPAQTGANDNNSQRPTRISREGEAQALYVYDSLANYQPRRRSPVVDVFV